ncbi:MAG TPA: phosphoribosylanthranilate isomerase [Aquifex aeolicus]|nr:phosphoribosylanthranilate isomerase [Aquifex aeolicus]
MVRVKICGITNSEDALFSVNSGADYIGVITYKKSPRYVSKEKRLEILNSLESLSVKKVAVVVNESYEFIKELLNEGFDLIQLHGDEDISLAKKVGMDRVIKVFRVKDTVPSVEEWKEAYAILLDTYSKNFYGGTGKTFNWEIASKLVEGGYKIFLSGGLKPENIEKAIKLVKPYAVDVSSGVEREKGRKDFRKVEEFIKTAKFQEI